MTVLPPTNLIATIASSTEVDLSWSLPQAYDDLVVQTSTDGTTWKQFGGALYGPQKPTTCKVTGLTPGQQYWFSVCGFVQGGPYPGPMSNVVTATPPVPVTVATPSIASVTLKMQASSNAPLAWTCLRGEIDANGNYTPPAAGGTDTITAESGIVSAAADVTVGPITCVPHVVVTPPPNPPPNPPPPPTPGPFIPPPAPPIPTEGQHPRLGITQAMLPALQAKYANAADPETIGFKAHLANCLAAYQLFFPNGTGALSDVPANPFPDSGETQGYPTVAVLSDSAEPVPAQVEAHAINFAFASLMETDPATKARYAGMARNLIMQGLSVMVQGVIANKPFEDPAFFVYNRNNATGHLWALTVDWIYPYLSASDKAVINHALRVWVAELLVYGATGGDWPQVVGSYKLSDLLPNGKPYRMAANNYYLGHGRTLIANSLCMDLADDPNGGLRNYLSDFLNAWLVQIAAMFQDADVFCADFGLTNVSDFGLASGGLPPEGSFYGAHRESLLDGLLYLKSCGCDDPSVFGPAVKLCSANFLDRTVIADLSWLENTQYTDPAATWEGPIFRAPQLGDSLRCEVLSNSGGLAALYQLQTLGGNTKNQNALRWAMINTPMGGAAAYANHLAMPWRGGGIDPIDAFLMMPAGAAALTDPRPGYPLTFVDKGLGQLVTRTDWGPQASAFYYNGCWQSINHQHGWGGAFTFYRKNEKLSGWMGNYDNNRVGLTAYCGNTLGCLNSQGVANSSAFGLEQFDYNAGSQFWLGFAAGDSATAFATADNDFSYASSNLTPLYNHVDQYTPSNSTVGITQVLRQILWLAALDTVVIFDQVKSQPGLFKRQYFCTPVEPVIPIINGNIAYFDTAINRLTITSLLLANPTLTAAEQASKCNPLADEETMKYVLTITDPTNPDPCDFLTVLQGTDAGVSALVATLIDADSVQIGSVVVTFGAIPSGLANGTVVYQCSAGGVAKVTV